MYRDDPLADEEELRAVIGDHAVDDLLEASSDTDEPIEVAVDVLRVLQGWVDDEAAASWFHSEQQRLEGHTPIAALVAGATAEVRAAAARWASAQG